MEYSKIKKINTMTSLRVLEQGSSKPRYSVLHEKAGLTFEPIEHPETGFKSSLVKARETLGRNKKVSIGDLAVTL